MSSTGQVTSSPSNFQLIINALADYANLTGIDLTKNPFAEKIERSNSPEAILELLQEREKAFKEYREGNRRLISCLSPGVKVLYAFSGIAGEAVSLAPFPPAKAVFTGIDVLLAAVNGVTSSYDAVLELFECLGNFLKRLEIYLTIPPTTMMTDVIIKIMVELLSVLALATKQIRQGRFKRFAKNLLGKREVEAVMQKLDQLTQDEARMAVTQTLGVVHGLVGNVRLVMEDGEVSTESIRKASVALHQVLNDINKMKRDQLQRDVRHWLSPPDPSSNHDFVWKAHHTGTAVWFFESDLLAEWKNTGSFLWIHGKPGSGKSTLLSAIIQDIEGMCAAGLATMAYYYFDFRDIKKQGRYGFLSSLLSQLCAKSDSCSDVLSQLYSNHAGGTGKPTTSALIKCMTDMLNLPGQGPIYIIIDALDECPDVSGTPSPREEVLELLEVLVGLNLSNLHLCVASRPEIDIRKALEPLEPLQISLHDEIGQKDDIIKYIRSVVHSDRKMRGWRDEDKQLVVEVLSEKSDGMFRWAVCQFDRLRRNFPASIRRVLDDLPESLDKTYEQTLLGIDKEKRKYAQRLFQCLSVSIRPLRVEELAEILAVDFDTTEAPLFNEDLRPLDAEEAVLSACSSLVAIVDRKGSQIVQFSHFSVKEYLTSDRLAKAEEFLSCYHIIFEPAHTLLAHVGLSVLLRLDDNIDRNAIKKFPFAPYSARHWVEHAKFRNVSSHVEGVMDRLFNPETPHFAAWVWLYDIDRYWVDPMSEIHPTQPEAVPLYYASLCGFRDLVGRLLASHSPDINSRGGFHVTPLHAATVKGHVEVASLLLQSGADPNSRDILDRVPLHRVSQGGQFVLEESSLEIARLLVNSGANVNVTDREGYAPLHAAAQSGYRDIAELLLGSGASRDARSNSQETALHLACLHGKLEVSRFLIDCGSDLEFQDSDGFKPLHGASRYGHVEVARLLLDCGSDVNVIEGQSLTPLHYASGRGHLDVARLLLDSGAHVDVYQRDGQTPIHFAAVDGHLDIAKLLIQRGANVDSRNDKERTPLDCAARNGFLDISRFLVECGADVFARDNEGWTPFHTASTYGHIHVAKFLLYRGIPVDVRNRNEETSLDLASGVGQLDVVHFLIENGADIHTKDKDGWNPVHIASHNGHIDIVRSLIHAGVPVDLQNGAKKTPLALASGKGNVEVVRFLIEQGADLYARDDQNWIPLHFASRYGQTEVARLFLDSDVDVNTEDGDRWSPLHLTAACGHVKLSRLLIQRAATIDILNEKEETPLDRAAGNGKADVARLLIDHGANVNVTDDSGWTPLHSAAYGGHQDVVKLLLRRGANIEARNKTNQDAEDVASKNNKLEVAKFLAEYKSDADVRNKIRSNTLDLAQYGADEDGKDDMASLLYAAEQGNIDLVESLLERGVDVNGRNESNNTPLSRAALKGNVGVVRLLIEKGAEVDPRDQWGWTPLHEASAHGHIEVSRVLLDHGANVNARQMHNWTPIHTSAVNEHLDIVKLLLERGADTHAMNSEGETPHQVSLRTGNRVIAALLQKHSADRLGESP